MASPANCSSVPHSHAPLIGDSPLQSLPCMLHVAASMPVMRSKPARHGGLPGYPDHAGMRQRRADAEMTVSRLQHSLGIQLAPKPDEANAESLWQYGYRQFSDFVGGIPEAGASALRALGKLVPFQQGGDNTLPAVLSSHFSKDFEMWASPSAQTAKDWRGATIVFGEIHNDHETLRTIGLAIHRLIAKDNDARVFAEGDGDWVCEDRRKMFSHDFERCQALEAGSKYFRRLGKLRDATHAKAKECADLVINELGVELTASDPSNPYPTEHAALVNRHYDALSLFTRLRLDPLIAEYNEADRLLQATADRFMSKRDEHMASSLRRERTSEGLNIVIVGAAHVNGLREHLKDLPCIFMVPRPVVARFPTLSLEGEREKPHTSEL